jgi:TonB family protein
LVNKVNPLYPPLARAARIEGDVRLQAVVAEDGTVEKVQVVSGHPFLIAAVIGSVKQWRYQPLAESALIEITISFRLPTNEKTITPVEIRPIR